MTPQEFCYWFQGFLEVSKTTTLTEEQLTEEQLTEVKKHLELAFIKMTDKLNFATKEELQKALNEHRCRPRTYC